jgi:hypothetical protein
MVRELIKKVVIVLAGLQCLPMSLALAQEPIKKEHLSPKPLKVLDDTVSFTRKTILGSEHIVKNPKAEISKLGDLHLSRYDKIKTIQGRAWNSFIRMNDKVGAIVLNEFYFSSEEGVRSKVVTNYVPLSDAEIKQRIVDKNRSSTKRSTSEFKPQFVRLYTPTFRAEGSGAFGQKLHGILNISVSEFDSSHSPDLPFNFDTIFLPSRFVTDTKTHFSRFELSLQKDRFQVEVRRDRNLLELRMWTQLGEGKKKFMRWLCDLNKDGNVVFFDTVSSKGEIEYEKRDDVWIPVKFRKKLYDLAAERWKEEIEIKYFDIRVNEAIPENTFRVKSFPVAKQNIIVTDRIANPARRIPFYDYIREND